jgi:hypothetical protein
LILLDDWIMNVDQNASEDDLPYKFGFDIGQEQDLEKNANALDVLCKFMPLKRTEAYALVSMTIPAKGDELFIPLNAGAL